MISVQLDLPTMAVGSIQLNGMRLHAKPRLLGVDLHMHAFRGLKRQQNPVRLKELQWRLAKQLLRRMAESKCDHGLRLGQSLAGAKIKRHPSPPPVIDIEFCGHIGFGHRVPLHPRLILVTRHRNPVDHARAVLGPKGMGMQCLLGDGPDGTQYFDLFVAQGICLQRRRWLHRHQSQ